MSNYIQVVTTTERKENAEKIAEVLIEERLAACIQVAGPIKSTYWWKGRIETTNEWLCIIKSKKTLYHKIKQAI